MTILLFTSSPEYLAYSEDSGRVLITVVHQDGTGLDPTEFLSSEHFEEGHYSVFDDDGDYVTDGKACNLGESCELILAAGIYEASIVDPNSLTTYTEAFEISANVTNEIMVKVDQGTFEISVLNKQGGEFEQISAFGHPGAYLEIGWFAMYELNGDYILDGVSCNFDDKCMYPYDSGTYVASIRKAADDQVISCSFDIRDNSLTPIEFYLGSDSCNQIVTVLPTKLNEGDSNTGQGNSGANTSGNTNSGSNANTTTIQDSASSDNTNDSNVPSTDQAENAIPTTHTPLQTRTVSILRTSSYIDGLGHYHLIGEVRNTQAIPAQDVIVTAVFYDNTKEVLAIKRAQAFLDYLKPGDQSPFDIVVKDTGASSFISNHTVSASFSNTTSSAKKGVLGVEVTNHYYSNETNQYHIEGRVFNYGEQNARFVKVTISVYDNSTNLLYVGQKYIASVLPSAALAEFTMAFAPKNVTEIAVVSASVQSDEFLMIGTASKMRETPITINLDSTSYDQGGIIAVNGTVGKFLEQEKYAGIYILWPNKINYDKEFVRITENGTYNAVIKFYSWEEFREETFVARIIYNNNFAEETFVFVSKPKSTAAGPAG